jgi:Ser/Thr protein kinase RdoA (MazF antagonist)
VQLDRFIQDAVLVAFDGLAGAHVAPLGSGLINQTYLVTAQPAARGAETGPRFVLQRLSPIFSPAINQNIDAVTRAVANAGLTTPRLLPARDGRLWLDLGQDGGVWRVQTFVPGISFDKVKSPAQAFAAGALVARFHRAVDDLDYSFVGLRQGVHDTERHLARLREAIAVHGDHRLFQQVQPLARSIFDRARDLAPLPNLPPRICHGDLKLNNILFTGADGPGSETAICLIDLDTVGPMPLAFELGDAWRSWCNPAGENTTHTAIDLDVFRASFDGYAGAIGRALTEDERQALLGGPEWISLELAARFAADALFENYFGWDASRYPSRGEHNLVRAHGQLALHEAFVATRAERARAIR